MTKPTYWQRLKIAFQYVMPQLYLTRLAGFFAEKEWGAVTHFVIKMFAKKYDINLSEAQGGKPEDYASFNQFFTRPLKEGARLIVEEDKVLACPADGRISECGEIDEDRLLQAKGHYFSLEDLLVDRKDLAEYFKDGTFVTTYLSPRDYHRVHMPCAATLEEMIYVPGELFSVNPFLAEHIPNLFARNERLICVFNTEFGKMVQILVGATITASMRTTWAGVINPPRRPAVTSWTYKENAPRFEKGEEMGAFQLGSTVINLFPKNSVTLDERLKVNVSVKMGEALVHLK